MLPERVARLQSGWAPRCSSASRSRSLAGPVTPGAGRPEREADRRGAPRRPGLSGSSGRAPRSRDGPRDREPTTRSLADRAWSLAKAGDRNVPALHSISQEASRRISALALPDLTRLAWASATLRYVAVGLFRGIAEEATLRKAELSPFTLSSLAWSFAKVVARAPELFDAIAPQAKLQEFNAHDLSSLAWALAKLRHESRALFQGIAEEATAKAQDFGPRHFSNLAWAFATATGLPGGLAEALAEGAVRQLEDFAPQALSNLAWAFAASRADPPGLLTAAAQAAAPRAREFSAQGLANLLWSCARLPVKHQPLLAAAGSALVRLEAWEPQDVSNVAWAVAVLPGPVDRALWRSLEGAARARLPQFQQQHLAGVAWSLATLRRRDGGLLPEIAGEAAARAREFQPRGLSNLLWAFAACGFEGQGSLHALAQDSAAKLSEFSPQALANVAWACAPLGADEEGLLPGLAREAAARVQELALKDLANLAWAFATLGRPEAEDLCPSLAGELEARLAASAPALCAESAVSVVSVVWALGFAGVPHGRLLLLARERLLQVGQALDDQRTSGGGALADHACGAGRIGLPATPHVALDLPDRMVVHKSPGFHVDQGGAREAEGARTHRLSGCLEAWLPPRRWPIVRDVEHQRGILHRLDAPSSGLLLVAKTYAAHYDLLLQLSSGRVLRDYLVLCRGWVAHERSRVEARLLWSTEEDSPSAVSDRGKPSLTSLRVLAHCLRQGEAFSLVAIRIATGRRHQIRTALSHIGHPVACDGKYSAPAAFQADRPWCPRNALHRYGLRFRDSRGEEREATAPLPADLRVALGQLSPRDAQSAEALKRWQHRVEFLDWPAL